MYTSILGRTKEKKNDSHQNDGRNTNSDVSECNRGTRKPFIINKYKGVIVS